MGTGGLGEEEGLWWQTALGSNPASPAYKLSCVRHTPLSAQIRILTTAFDIMVRPELSL